MAPKPATMSDLSDDPEATPDAVTGAQPASELPPTPVAPRVSAAAVAVEAHGIPKMTPKDFANFKEADAAEMCREVYVQVVGRDLKGAVNLVPFHFHKDQVIKVQKWFALSHRDVLVIKE